MTGGAGFVGAHLVEALLAKGAIVHVLDTPALEVAPRLRRVHERIHYFQGSILGLDLVRAASRDVNLIFHQPSLGSITDSIKDPLSVNRTGTEGTLNVLIAARENGVKRVVYGSSASVYGNGGRLPRAEDSPLEPISPHGVAMLAGENYCAAFTDNHGLETVRLRQFNFYGRESTGTDEPANVLQAFLAAVAADRRPLIFGDGMQTRDFVHIDDVVQANLLAAANPRAAGKAYNIGSGQRTTLLGLLGMMGRHLDTTLKPMFTRARPGDIRFSLADTSVTQRDLGFCPCTNLAQDLPMLMEAPESVLRGPRSAYWRANVFAGEMTTD
ncbi:MAG TPA: NAD-dependent epimerase/dehydratase family protein [Gemmataceae bacterium]|nr:NAD-dependent epimerase/dehydratase family protein [Gemmataceae bacterium]